jgi:hypothetical protein
MNNRFDELTKSLAQSVTRRSALKKFGLGLAGMALACFGLANKAESQSACLPNGYTCSNNRDCCSGHCQSFPVYGKPGKDHKYWACAA